MINFDQIEDNIFIGSAPQSSIDISRLKSIKISAVLSLQSDDDFRHYNLDWDKLKEAYQQHDILIERFPIADFDETDLGNKVAEPIERLNQLLQVGHTAYVHCNAGICRAPATVLGYLCHYRQMTIDEGLSYLRNKRPQVNPYLAAVERALIQLSE